MSNKRRKFAKFQYRYDTPAMTRHLLTLLATVLPLMLSACNVKVLSNIEEEQANRALIALGTQHIDAEKSIATQGEDNRFDVAVGRSQVVPALRVLNAHGLPEKAQKDLQQMLSQGALTSSSQETQAKMLSALGVELSRSISLMQGIVKARVHIAMPQKTSLLSNTTASKPQASVLATYHSIETRPAPETIQTLIAGAMPHMSQEDVHVVWSPAQLSSSSNASDSMIAVGPFKVAPASAGLLKVVLMCAVGLNLLLALALFWVMRVRDNTQRNIPIKELTQVTSTIHSNR